MATYALIRHVQLMDQSEAPRGLRRLVVIVPIKGLGRATEAFLKALSAQDHRSYRIVFAVESAHDAVLPKLRTFRDTGTREVEIVLAGFAVDTGQKVWNQLAALDRIRPDDDVIVFADADIVPPHDWLNHLDWAVIDANQPIVTGYRLMVPTDNRLGSFIGASANLSVAGAGRPTRLGLAWGGTIAMSRETCTALDLPRVWLRALSDDVMLGVAARARRLPIITERRMLIETPWSADVAEVFEFGVRQFWMFRTSWPLGFAVAIVTLLLPVAGFVAALGDILAGGFAGWLALTCLVVLGEWRVRLRREAIRKVVGDARMPALRQWLAFDRFGRPLCHLFTIAAATVAAVRPTITWSGITYALSGPNATRILSRITPAPGPPSAD